MPRGRPKMENTDEGSGMNKCGCRCCDAGGVLCAVVVAIFVPLLFIWALDTLFVLTIPFTVWTWFAALVVVTVISGGWRGWARHRWCFCSLTHRSRRAE